jgi:ABC-type oligopeptide transport system ATPase subunit
MAASSGSPAVRPSFGWMPPRPRKYRSAETAAAASAHDLSILRQISDYLYVMHRGRVVEPGPTDQVPANPSDAYTIKLLDSVPRAETDWLAGAKP